MFDSITTIGRPGAAARKGSSFAFSVGMHGLAVVLAVVFTVVKERFPSTPDPVSVQFRAPPPPPPPPPPASRKKKRPDRPKTPVVPRVPPNTIVQPKEMPKVEEKPPETAPIEDESDDDEGVEGGVEGGVAGGVVGGVLGGVVGGTGTKLGEEGPPLILGSGMTRPQQTSACRPPKPMMPEQARTMGISGMVLVEFVVHSDGHAGEIVLKNKTAPPILFQAVKSWLEGCTYTPSILTATGRPVPVKMIVPFQFSLRG